MYLDCLSGNSNEELLIPPGFGPLARTSPLAPSTSIGCIYFQLTRGRRFYSSAFSIWAIPTGAIPLSFLEEFPFGTATAASLFTPWLEFRFLPPVNCCIVFVSGRPTYIVSILGFRREDDVDGAACVVGGRNPHTLRRIHCPGGQSRD